MSVRVPRSNGYKSEEVISDRTRNPCEAPHPPCPAALLLLGTIYCCLFPCACVYCVYVHWPVALDIPSLGRVIMKARPVLQ